MRLAVDEVLTGEAQREAAMHMDSRITASSGCKSCIGIQSNASQAAA